MANHNSLAAMRKIKWWTTFPCGQGREILAVEPPACLNQP
jgi:hypothetical protein